MIWQQWVSVLAFLIITALACIAIIVYDVWAIRTWGMNASISRASEALGHMVPLYPFTVGLLIGFVIGVIATHFWWKA